jgi:hypothetical protein
MLLIEVDPCCLLIDETSFPDKEKDNFIFEHLVYFSSKGNLLPTLIAKVESQGAFVTRGHHYLEIAKSLKRKRIRVVIEQSSLEIHIQKFLAKITYLKLDWEAERLSGSDVKCGYIWCVFFFERAVDNHEKQIFEEKIINFFRDINLPVGESTFDQRIKNLSCNHLDTCIEFEAYVPILDESWYAQSRQLLIDFHLNHVPIASFQGRRFLIS